MDVLEKFQQPKVSGVRNARMRAFGNQAIGSGRRWLETTLGFLVPTMALVLLAAGVSRGMLRAERTIAHRDSMLERAVVDLHSKSFDEIAALKDQLAHGGADKRYRVDLEVQRRGEKTLEIHAVLVDRRRNAPIDRLVTFRRRRGATDRK